MRLSSHSNADDDFLEQVQQHWAAPVPDFWLRDREATAAEAKALHSAPADGHRGPSTGHFYASKPIERIEVLGEGVDEPDAESASWN